MAINVTVYDAKDTSVIVNNTYITGLGEDMISIEKDEDFSPRLSVRRAMW